MNTSTILQPLASATPGASGFRVRAESVLPLCPADRSQNNQLNGIDEVFEAEEAAVIGDYDIHHKNRQVNNDYRDDYIAGRIDVMEPSDIDAIARYGKNYADSQSSKHKSCLGTAVRLRIIRQLHRKIVQDISDAQQDQHPDP